MEKAWLEVLRGKHVKATSEKGVVKILQVKNTWDALVKKAHSKKYSGKGIKPEFQWFLLFIRCAVENTCSKKTQAKIHEWF